jgi:hypothetical protein
MGLLAASQLLDVAAGGALIAYLAFGPPAPGASDSGPEWWSAHVLRNRPHMWLLGIGTTLRGVVSLVLRLSARSFRIVATPVWVVVITVLTFVATVVELVHWRHVLPRSDDTDAERVARRGLRASIGALAWLCLAALAQEGLLRAKERLRARRPPRARFGDASLRTNLISAVADDGADDDDRAEDGRDEGEGAKVRGLGGKAGRIYALARPEWPSLTVGFLALIGSTLSSLLVPKFFGGLVNSVGAADETALAAQTRLLVLILVAGAALTLLRAFLFNAAGERVVARLRGRLFARMLAQDCSFFDASKSGELVSRLTSDCTKLQSAATSDLSVLLRSVVMVLLSFALMATTQLQLTLVVLGVIPPMSLAAVLYGRAISSISKRYQDAVSRASDVSAESLGALKTVRAFGAEPLQLAQYVAAVGDPDSDRLPDLWRAVANARRAPPPPRARGERAPPSGAALPSAYALGVAKALYLSLFIAGITLAFYLAMIAILW